jgi:sulfate transport system ATP-binding protein
MNEGQLQQVGPPREVYDHPANQFVMGFLGPVSKLGDRLVRPHDVAISLVADDGATEAMVSRVVHLGFEVRVELDLPDGTSARAQLTRSQTAELELARGDIVYVRTMATGTASATMPEGDDESASAMPDEDAPPPPSARVSA